MVEFVSIFLVVIATTLVVRVVYVISQSSKPVRNTSQKPFSTLVVLGSGKLSNNQIYILSLLKKTVWLVFKLKTYIICITYNLGDNGGVP